MIKAEMASSAVNDSIYANYALACAGERKHALFRIKFRFRAFWKRNLLLSFFFFFFFLCCRETNGITKDENLSGRGIR